MAYKVLAIDNEILLQNIEKDVVLGELSPKKASPVMWCCGASAAWRAKLLT